MTRLLGIRPGEGKMVGWLVATFTVIQSSHPFGANAADALFFLRFGVDELPAMIMISGVAVMGLMIGHAMGLGALGAYRWLPVSALITTGWAVAEWVGVMADVPGIYPVVWVSTQVVMLVTLTLMWNAAGAACTTRQAKRLFPLFATAGVAGAMTGNLLTGPLAALLGTENLLLVHALLLLGGTALVFPTRRFFASDEPSAAPTLKAELAETIAVVRRSRLLRLAALVAVFTNVLFYLVYFPFSQAVATSLGSEQEVAAFLGFFSFAATATTFLVSLLVTNRLFSRLGLVMSLLIVPIAYVGGFSLWLVGFALVTAAVVRGLLWVVNNAIGATAFPALFNVVTGRRRGEIVTFMTAVPAQVGVVLAGLLLIVARDLPDQVTFGLGLAISLLMLIVVLRLRPAYLDAVVTAVRQGVVGVFDVPTQGLLTPDDGDTRRVLLSHLGDSRPAARVVAVSGLADMGGETDSSSIEPLLTDADPAVRAAAFDSICVIDPDRVASHAAVAISDDVPEVRLQVLHYLASHPESDGVAAATNSLNDPDPRVRAAAAVVVGGQAGEETLRALAAGDDPRGVVAALVETSDRGGPPVVDPRSLLGHDDPRVRAAAASAVDVSDIPPEVIVPCLDDRSPRVRVAAAESLSASPEGSGLLLGVLGSGSVIATEAALNVLTPMDDLVPEFTDWARREAERAALLLACDDALQAETVSSAAVYLRHVLGMRIDRLLRWVLHAMTTGDTRSVMSLVERGVHADDPETRSQAIEALETIGARTVLSVLLPLLEPDHVPGSLSEEEALQTLTDDFDPWLSRLAARAADERSGGPTPGTAGVASYPSMPPTAETSTLSPFERVLLLQEVPMFAGLDPEDLEMVARVTTERRYEASAPIYEEGEIGEEMLVVVAGSAVVSVSDGTTRRVIHTYGPGEHVGELALLGAGVRSADVTAGNDGAHGLVLAKSDLMSVLEERPSVTMGMLGTLARRLVDQTPDH